MWTNTASQLINDLYKYIGSNIIVEIETSHTSTVIQLDRMKFEENPVEEDGYIISGGQKAEINLFTNGIETVEYTSVKGSKSQYNYPQITIRYPDHSLHIIIKRQLSLR